LLHRRVLIFQATGWREASLQPGSVGAEQPVEVRLGMRLAGEHEVVGRGERAVVEDVAAVR
jgi:hypothetical protein